MFLCINVYAEGEATLNFIKVGGKECTCNGYECSVEVDAKSVIVTYELTDSNATVDRNSGFSIDLNSQSTLIKIVVSNTVDGEKVENTYNVTINKHEKSDDYTLKKLVVNEKEIELLEDVFVYSYEAKYDDEVIKIEAETNDSNAKVILEKEYEFEEDRSSLAIDFDVKAENGDTKTYRIVVSRGIRPDTSLKSLKIDKVKFDFNKDKLNYEFDVEYSVNDLIIEAIANDDKATVKIEKEDLVVGENEIKIIVTNDKAESTYLLKVTREPNLDKSLANLSKLEISEYPKLGFEENVLEYTLKFSEIPNKLTIKAVSQSSDGRINITGNEDLEDGSIILVSNTLIETGITREYKLILEKNTSISDNKNFILVSIVVLIIVMIILFVFEIKDRKMKRHAKLTKIKELKKKKDLKEMLKKEKKAKGVSTKDDDIEII